MASAMEISAIVAGINSCDAMPEAARGMLLGALPHACEGLVEHKNELQARLLKLIETSFEQQKATFAGRVEALAGEAAAAERQLEEQRAAVTVATEALQAADAVVATKEGERDAVAEAARVAQADHAKAEKAATKKTDAWAQLRESLERATIASTTVKELAEGACAPEAVSEKVSSVVEAFLAEIKAEKVLVAAAAVALALPVEARTDFDRLTVEHTLQVVEGKVSALQARLAEIAPEEAELRAELLGLWAIAAVEQDRELAAAQALGEAERDRKKARRALAEAEAAERSTREAQSGHVAERSSIDEKAQLLEAALTAVARVLTMEPAEVAEAPAAEEAPAEAAADVEMQPVEQVPAKDAPVEEEAPAQVACAGA